MSAGRASKHISFAAKEREVEYFNKARASAYGGGVNDDEDAAHATRGRTSARRSSSTRHSNQHDALQLAIPSPAGSPRHRMVEVQPVRTQKRDITDFIVRHGLLPDLK